VPEYNLKVHSKLRKANPQHTAEQFSALEAHILRVGEILEPIILWKDFIVDGHGRYAVAKKHGLDYQVRIIDFETEEHAVMFARAHQNCRRNNARDLVLYNIGLVHAFYEEEAIKAKVGKKNAAVTQKVAKEFGVSESTVRHAAAHRKNVEALDTTVRRSYLDGRLKGGSMRSVEKLAKLEKGAQKRVKKLVDSGEAKTVDAAVRRVKHEQKLMEAESKPKPKKVGGEASKTFKAKDKELQKSFDAWKRMVRYMPKEMYEQCRPQCDMIHDILTSGMEEM